jgi:hypothetical protein
VTGPDARWVKPFDLPSPVFVQGTPSRVEVAERKLDCYFTCMSAAPPVAAMLRTVVEGESTAQVKSDFSPG